MGWLLMVLINAAPSSILVNSEAECYAMGYALVNYYHSRPETIKAICRKVYVI